MDSSLLSITGIFAAGFISVSIFLMQDKSLQYSWDRDLILKSVIKVRKLLVAVSLMTFPLIFWRGVPFAGKVAIFISYFIGVYILWRSLLSSYRWIRSVDQGGPSGHISFRMQKRFEYLESPPDVETKIIAWESVFDTDKQEKTILEERRFMKRFIKFYSKASDEMSDEQKSALFTALYQNTGNISLDDTVVFQDLVKALFGWKRDIFSQSGDNSKYIRSRPAIDRLIKELIALAFQEKITYPLFHLIIKNHVEESDPSSAYLDDLFLKVIAPEVFENVEGSPESFEFWEANFPDQWQVESGLSDRDEEDRYITKLFLQAYLRWAQERIRTAGEEWDKDLENVSNGLFPDVNSKLFSTLMTLMLRPYGDSRMADLVEKDNPFGRMGVSVSASGEDVDLSRLLDRKAQEERECTIDLVLEYFDEFFTEDRLQIFIEELGGLEYPDDSKNEKRRKYLIQIFNTIIDKL